MEFVDPRTNPQPPVTVIREPASHGEELRELIAICAAGRIYDAERWIQEGKPIQALSYAIPRRASIVSPLRVAIRRGHQDVALLLLCNGYNLDLEQLSQKSLLDEALEAREQEMLDLLLSWGADPTQVQVDNVLETYDSTVIERFWRAGLDLTADGTLAFALAHTVNKPLYGWIRQRRSERRLQDALDVALLEAVIENREAPVALLLWAGADPHRKVPLIHELRFPDAWQLEDQFSGAEAAISFGRPEMFDRLRVANLPDLETLFAHANDLATLKKLTSIRLPGDWSASTRTFLHRVCWRHGGSLAPDSRDALKFIADHGGRLTGLTVRDLRYLRSDLIDLRDVEMFKWVMRWLGNPRHCDPAIFAELTRTKAMRQRMDAIAGGVRYVTPSQKKLRSIERRRRAADRARPLPPSGSHSS